MNDIGAIIERLAPLIEEKVREEINLLVNLHDEAQKLSSTLMEIEKVLDEAERRRLTDPRVRAWLERLGHVMYEIDDALDHFQIAELDPQNQGFDHNDHHNSWWHKVCLFVKTPYLGVKHVFKRREIAVTIRSLNEKVDALDKEQVKYSMLPVIYDNNLDDARKRIDTSFGEVLELTSQKKNLEAMVDELVGKSDQLLGFKTISVLGMPGVGKTTLARLAYIDERVASHFEKRSWISVSHHVFDELRFAQDILCSLSPSQTNVSNSFQVLLECIKLSVDKKKFLLVLDDVCINDDNVWNQLKASLSSGAPGSRILVTSRKENTARLMGSAQVFRMRPEGEKDEGSETLSKTFHENTKNLIPVSHDDCWLILERFSLLENNVHKDLHQLELENIGRKLGKKCSGLPLVAKVLGIHLQSTRNITIWRKVLRKKFWELDEVAKTIFASFEILYSELPLELRRCFSYCGSIPRRHFVNRPMGTDELVRHWSVQGYLGGVPREEMEVKAEEIMEKLQMCFLVTCVGDSKWTMNGLLHDFARYLLKNSLNKDAEKRILYSVCDLTPEDLKSNNTVRMIILNGSKVLKLPRNLGTLIHLRFLDLSDTDIEELPSSICKLHNLQTLDVALCRKLAKLPKRMYKLRKLWFLSISMTNKPNLDGLRGLSSLQRFIGDFTVISGAELGYLNKLNQLQAQLRIVMESSNKRKATIGAKKARLDLKKGLKDLHLIFKVEVSIDVLEALKPSSRLESLVLENYICEEFPKWIADKSILGNLTVFEIRGCNKCTSLPPLVTLPLLEKLYLSGMSALKSIGPKFLGPEDESTSPDRISTKCFPRLRYLELIDCRKLREWQDNNQIIDETEIMPCLVKLIIHECPKLQMLPYWLRSRIKNGLPYKSNTSSTLLIQKYGKEFENIISEPLSP